MKVKIFYFLFCMFMSWPILFTYLSPANNSIITFIFYICDHLTVLKKNIKMVHSEYVLLNGHEPKALQVHIWLCFIVLIKIIQLNCCWIVAMAVHLYSPLFNIHINHRLVMIYFFIVLYYLMESLYIRYYKTWIVKYNVVSTNDAEVAIDVTR
jgi:hypothetical protein